MKRLTFEEKKIVKNEILLEEANMSNKIKDYDKFKKLKKQYLLEEKIYGKDKTKESDFDFNSVDLIKDLLDKPEDK